MSRSVCGARTWGDGEPVSCTNEAGHEGRHRNPSYGLWLEPECCVGVCGQVFSLSVDEARAVRDRLQRQLDALDPDAAIAEAERRMVEAWDRSEKFRALHSLASDKREAMAFQERWFALCNDRQRATDAWLSLVEARSTNERGTDETLRGSTCG